MLVQEIHADTVLYSMRFVFSYCSSVHLHMVE